MRIPGCLLIFLFTASTRIVWAQPLGTVDRAEPGDAMIQAYLEHETRALEPRYLSDASSAEDWSRLRPKFAAEYMDMLGLLPLPAKTELHATVTRTLDRGDYVVEMLHYQSRPGLYVTANVYRPASAQAGQRHPAVLYVCGHSGRGRNGNKTAFQSHGIWFARHGYVCLLVDTLQLGEIPGIHHGTYREGRWWWLSRGYTPAGVECWNGIRGIDYLVSRPDVDPDRIGVTGISGGGAATFWIAAADERVKAAAAVSGMADLQSYVPNRVVNGHCDCMFLYNTYQWPWTRIAALVAPRPLLFVNSDRDSIFPMDANERVINRLERFYSLFGRSDWVDSVVSIGGHAYRQDIREATFRFLNTWLKDDPRPVRDSEIDLVRGEREQIHPIPPEELRVFPTDSDIPSDALNGRIDREFVPQARVEVPADQQAFEKWKAQLLAQLKERTFHHFPPRVPAAQLGEVRSGTSSWLATEYAIRVRLDRVRPVTAPGKRIVLVVSTNAEQPELDWLRKSLADGDGIYVLEPRGWGSTRWTRRNPPNYIERAHYLLGRTVDSGRVWDIAAAARYLKDQAGPAEIVLAGTGTCGALTVYAALLETDVTGLILRELPSSHMEDSAPALLNVLRVCDLAEALGMVAPRPVTVVAGSAKSQERAGAIYRAAGAAERFHMGPPTSAPPK